MLIDAHTHLDHYADDMVETALQEIEDYQILTLSNAMDPDSYRHTLRLSERSDLIIPSFGIHPWRAANYVDQLPTLQSFIEQSSTLGELGLDYYFVKDKSTFPAQRKVFEFFLGAAREQDKVVNLHTKGAEIDVLKLLDQHLIRRAIIHWYSGPLDIFREMVSRGLYFTVGVELLYSEHIQNIARELPLDQLLTETDNPGGWEWFTENPGMPHHLIDVIKKLGEIKQLTDQDIERSVQQNFMRLFDDDPWLGDKIKLLEVERKGS